MTRYSSMMASEFLGLIFFCGEFDRLCPLLVVEGELVNFFIIFGDVETDLEGVGLDLEWDEQTLEWASRSSTLHGAMRPKIKYDTIIYRTQGSDWSV